ncbi:hypothetical protein PVAND_001191 [Polypedilum vanderplanki]|uniref:DUF4789 domain-containing protein n=1 Tax=Polypedilum vanderplanki TaxID=319348 RepID=A0A9J6BMG4_POLVA|nr:hypothetical protein PVAND_001191 [Polypedilum vanderplanki]
MIGKIVVILFSISITLSVAQVFFQSSETDQNKQPTKHSRKPIESDKCEEGELFYPGDNEKDWVCDCKPAYVYHPETLKCYAVYTQGPCKNNEILIMPPKKTIPKCQRNTCVGTKVSFRGRCVTLNTNEGCPSTHLFSQVNATSLQLTCAINLGSRFNENGEEDEENSIPDYNYNEFPIDNSIGAVCLLGGKRSQEQKCLA